MSLSEKLMYLKSNGVRNSTIEPAGIVITELNANLIDEDSCHCFLCHLSQSQNKKQKDAVFCVDTTVLGTLSLVYNIERFYLIFLTCFLYKDRKGMLDVSRHSLLLTTQNIITIKHTTSPKFHSFFYHQNLRFSNIYTPQNREN